MRAPEPIVPPNEDPTGLALPDPDDANVTGIAASHDYLAGFAALFPRLKTARLAINQYTVIKQLGAGAMGVVYLAYDSSLDRKVALKVVRGVGNDGKARARMVREAKSLAKLSHPNIVQVYEVGQQLGEMYIAMEYIEGQSLLTWLTAPPRSFDARMDVLVAAGRGLVEAHAQGIIHRDIKPANILVAASGRVCVADFGLAANERAEPRTLSGRRSVADESARTLTHAGAGTPEYMSPEQHRQDELDARSDVFGFCVVVWEVVYGTRPFVADTEGLREAICAGHITPPKHRPRGATARLEQLLRRGLAKDRQARPRDMRSLVAELERLRQRRSWLPIGVLGVGVLAAFVMRQAYRAPEVCTDIDQGLSAVWSATSGQELAAAIRSPRREAVLKVADGLDQFADDLRAIRGALCQRHSDKMLTPEAYDVAQACLDERQTELAAMARGLRTPQGTVNVTPLAVAEAHARLGRCDDPKYLATGIAPPDQDKKSEVEAIHALRARGEDKLLSGEFVGAAGAFAEAVRRARAVGHAPTTAAALYDEGRTLLRLRRGAAAMTALREARLLADGASDQFLAADASLLLVNAAVSSNDLAAADWYARETEALLGRTGRGREAATAELELARVDLLVRAGQVEEADTRLQHASEVLARYRPAGGLWRFNAPRLAARVAELRGRPADAARAIEQAWQALESLVGDADHPLYSEERGRYALLAGDPAAAELSLQRALATYTAAFGPGSAQVASVEVALARVFQAQRRLPEMVAAATRADEILRAQPEDPMTLDDRVALADILGAAAAEAGDYGEALDRYEQSWRALVAAKVPVFDDSLMRLASNAAEILVDVPEQRDLARANLAIAAALARLDAADTVAPNTAAFVRRVAADVALASADPRKAVDHAEAAHALLPAVTDTMTVARVDYTLARALGVEDPRSEPLIAEAVRLFKALGRPDRDIAEIQVFLRGAKDNIVMSKRGTDRRTR